MANVPGAVQGARIVGERFVRTRRRQNPEGRMPLMEHLRELRKRLVKSVLVIILGMIVALISPTRRCTSSRARSAAR